MSSNATETVISYVVHPNGTLHHYDELQKALDDGYRVVDVRPIAAMVGGGAAESGVVVVTVLLSLHSSDGSFYVGGRHQ